MKDRGMTDEERDLAEALAQTFDAAVEAQVTVYFESGYRGGIVVRLAWEGRQDSLHFPWRDVARLLTSHLSHDEQERVGKFRDDA
jgi:hypothetical protein